MHLLLNSTGGAAGGDLQARSGVEGESGFHGRESRTHAAQGGMLSDSPFSRLLAGKLVGSQESQSGLGGHTGIGSESRIDRASTQSETQSGQGDSDLESDDFSKGNPEANGNHDQMSGENGSIATSFEAWSGLLNLVQISGPIVMGNGTIPDFSMSGGLPVEFQSRLAEDIAANYSNRNGIQTITLKLEADHLGQVDVRLQAKGDHLSVRLLAANRESEAALRGNIKELSEAIQKRTGRFQHVEVRVDLKGSEDLGQESADEDPHHSPDRDPRGETQQDPESESRSENPNTTEMETEPGNRAQGG